MKKFGLCLLPILFLLLPGSVKAHYESTQNFYVIPPTSGIGQSTVDEDAVDDLKDKIEEYERKIKQLQGKEKTLENEIGSLDGQVNLIQLKIRDTENNIQKREAELKGLVEDITVLSGKISILADKVSYQSLLFNQRMRIRYKNGVLSPFDYVFNDNFNSLIQKMKFIKEVEREDSKLISQLKDTKQNYEWQKTALEEKKIQVEEVKKKIEVEKASLVSYKANLDAQKREKNALLEQTRGSEATYQDLLRKAKAELDAIEGAVASINFSNGSKVDDGDVIAVMGNSGYPMCSTGAHLHFEVRKSGSVVNAESYVKPKSLYVADYVSGYKTLGSGKWDWPMKDMEVTQRYGKTPWSWRYAGNKHTGIDMVSSNTLIYAPDDGRMIKGTTNCYGSYMNYVAIDHGDGVISYYFHVK